MSREELPVKGRYYSIIQGSFRTQVPKDHPDAVEREWEATDGTKGTKWEREVKAVIGFIKDIQIVDTEFGTQVKVFFDEDDEGDQKIVALNAKSREGEDFLKKLPNIDLSKEVRLRPFKFEGDRGDDVRGMEVVQQDDEGSFKRKITNFFYDPETKENLNGFPKPEGDTDMFTKDDWKIYFLQANKWLVNYIQKNILPKLKDGSFSSIKDEIPF